MPCLCIVKAFASDTNVSFDTVMLCFSSDAGKKHPSCVTHSDTCGLNYERRGRKKKKILWRHSSVPLNVMFKPKSLSACVWFVCVCVSVTDKEITASSLAERSALASRTDCRYEAVSAGPSPLSLAGSGSPGGRLRPSGPAPSQRETLLHCRCGDRLELLRE